MPAAVDRARRAIERVGASAPPAEFRAAVAEAMREALQVSDEEIRRRFTAIRGYQDFRALLRQAEASPGSRILAVGSGSRMGGRKAAYAAEVAREESAGAAVEEWNWDAGAADGGACGFGEGEFDLVVTHSFLHYLPDFSPACQRLRRFLKPGGRYLMANEPNLRFGRNPECTAAIERVDRADGRRRRLLRLFNPRSYTVKLRRIFERRGTEDAFAKASRLVRERLGLRGALTVQEIIDVLEPHREGLDWEELGRGALAGMRLEAVRTSGWVARHNPARVPSRWSRLDRDLAARYPLDGCMFSALWRQA